MMVLQIEDVKEFMNHLFVSDMFDRFHVIACEVGTFVTFSVNGKWNEEWYDTDEKPEDKSGVVTWYMLKTAIFELIKGKKTPVFMKMDFCHYMTNGDVASLRVEYDKEKLLVYTGYMQKEFSLDKEAMRQWDDNCLEFMRKNNIVSNRID